MGTHPIFESDFDCLTEKCAIDLGTVEVLKMPSGKVYVGNLGADPLEESDLEEEFEEFGSITSIFVARNPPGFAYIDFDDDRDAKDAVYELSQRKRICGRKRVKIEISHKGSFLASRKRGRSISPETYRKYGSRTPSPIRKRSRSRSPISKRAPLKPNKPKMSSEEDSSEDSTSSSSSEEEVKLPPKPVKKSRPKSVITKVKKYKNYVITRQFRNERRLPEPHPNQDSPERKSDDMNF